jgi:two-component system, OmpR family, phosphate regulon sensor histidine kinase PhoR
MFRSVFFRDLFVPIVLLIVIAVSGLGLIAAERMNTLHMESRKESMRGDIQLAGVILEQPVASRDMAQITRKTSEIGEKTLCRVTVIDEKGVVLADNQHDPATMENHLNRPEIQSASLSEEGFEPRRSDTLKEDLYYMARRVKLPDGSCYYVRLAVKLETLNQQKRILYNGIIIVAAGLCVMGGLAAYWIARNRAMSLVELADAARAFSERNFDHRAPAGGKGEIAELATDLNEMADSLRNLLKETESGKAELLTILASMAEGVIAADADQKILVVNEAATRFLPMETPQVVGRPLWQAVRIDRVIQAAQEAIAGKRSQFELGIINGRNLEITVSPIHSVETAGRVRGLVLVIHDTTQSVRYQELRREFVANVSHELRTPLSVIKGYVETLIDGAMSDPVKGPQFLDTVNRHATQLTNLVNDLLELSKLESQPDLPGRQPVDISLCLKRAVELLYPAAAKKKQELTLEMQPAPLIFGNSDHVERAAANLIDNAVKYTQEGGKIHVSLQHQGSNVYIQVADNGIGIPAEDIPRIFERFYRVDRSRSREMGGTGLGLSIVKHIAQTHGGSVEVSSSVGKGSTFRLRLPTPGK